ncbi:hypothetical protein U8V72_23195 [Priestia filamentosa]|uniref:hypothetical protein n=1 Tax=Priestia filamentosa TaxID=1402861 RepID=UPI00058913B7
MLTYEQSIFNLNKLWANHLEEYKIAALLFNKEVKEIMKSITLKECHIFSAQKGQRIIQVLGIYEDTLIRVEVYEQYMKIIITFQFHYRDRLYIKDKVFCNAFFDFPWCTITKYRS